MRLHHPLRYLLALVLVCGSVALAATQWTVQPKESKLTFVGTALDAPFDGTFERFTADIKFDPKDLASSRFDVKIDTGSANTRNEDRDEALKNEFFFAVKQYPAAHFVAERFTSKGGNKYSAAGKLTIRNVTRDVPIEFTFETKNGSAWLKGGTQLKRLDFGVGQGEYKDTSQVGNDVKVNFVLLLKP